MANLNAFTQQELHLAYSDILQQLLAPPVLVPQKQPQAVLLGGQSGAGKTMLHHFYQEQFDRNVIIVNGDDFRPYHPHYRELFETYGEDAASHTAKWSGEMTEALIDSLASLGYNLVIEGTLRTFQTPLSTAELLKQKGYRVSLAIMAVKPEISFISYRIRYLQMRLAGTTPRAATMEHHRLIVDNIASNLAVLENSDAFDSIGLFSREMKQLYPNPKEARTAAEALQEILFGPWTPQETYHYQHLQSLLKNLENQQQQK